MFNLFGLLFASLVKDIDIFSSDGTADKLISLYKVSGSTTVISSKSN